RVQHRPADRTGGRGPDAAQSGIDLPCLDSPRATGLDQHEVGRLRDEPQGEVLRADQGRRETAPGRGDQLGASHGARRAVPRGEVVIGRRFVQRLSALVRFRRLEHELDAEIQAHLELAERDLRAAGLSVVEAGNEARRRFGGITQVQDAHRDSRGVRWLENLIKDARDGAASLTRDPVFSLVAIGVLALGIGANTAMFSLIDAVFLKPLPFPEPDRIVRVWEAPTPVSINSTTPGDFLAMNARSTMFEA